MKQTFVSIIILFSVITCGQSLEGLPENNAVWVNGEGKVIHTPFVHCPINTMKVFFANNQDTIIGGLTYSKLFMENQGYKGAYRNDSGKVLYVPNDSIKEFILYDFTLQVGDSVTFYYELGYGLKIPGELTSLVVSHVDTFHIGGQDRRVLHLDNQIGSWIDGIGQAQGLLLDPFTRIADYCLELYCMSHNGSQLYGSFGGSGDCPLDISVLELKRKQNSIQLYPNPSSEFVYINLSSEYSSITYQIFNSTGILLENGHTTESMIRLPTQNGIYLVSIIRGDSRSNHWVRKE